MIDAIFEWLRHSQLTLLVFLASSLLGLLVSFVISRIVLQKHIFEQVSTLIDDVFEMMELIKGDVQDLRELSRDGSYVNENVIQQLDLLRARTLGLEEKAKQLLRKLQMLRIFAPGTKRTSIDKCIEIANESLRSSQEVEGVLKRILERSGRQI